MKGILLILIFFSVPTFAEHSRRGRGMPLTHGQRVIEPNIGSIFPELQGYQNNLDTFQLFTGFGSNAGEQWQLNESAIQNSPIFVRPQTFE